MPNPGETPTPVEPEQKPEELQQKEVNREEIVKIHEKMTKILDYVNDKLDIGEYLLQRYHTEQPADRLVIIKKSTKERLEFSKYQLGNYKENDFEQRLEMFFQGQKTAYCYYDKKSTKQMNAADIDEKLTKFLEMVENHQRGKVKNFNE
jgi:hypothetical protein